MKLMIKIPKYNFAYSTPEFQSQYSFENLLATLSYFISTEFSYLFLLHNRQLKTYEQINYLSSLHNKTHSCLFPSPESGIEKQKVIHGNFPMVSKSP